MTKLQLMTFATATLAPVALAPADVLWDNGRPNGVNGYSNATSGVFGFRRTLLDDFQLDEPSTLQELHWESVWGTPMGGTVGTGAQISIRSDVGGTPGMEIAVANLTEYEERMTIFVMFDREVVEHWATFDDISLDAGRYWFEAAVVGPENNFWMTADQQLNECWVDYEDLGGFQPGTDQFGVAADLNFVLSGVPAPGVLAAIAFAGVATRRRRRPMEVLR